MGSIRGVPAADLTEALRNLSHAFPNQEKYKDSFMGKWVSYGSLEEFLRDTEESLGTLIIQQSLDPMGWWNKYAKFQETKEMNHTLKKFYTKMMPFDPTTQEVGPRILSAAMETQVVGLHMYRQAVYAVLESTMTPEGARHFLQLIAQIPANMSLTYKMLIEAEIGASPQFFATVADRGRDGYPHSNLSEAFAWELANFCIYTRDERAIYKVLGGESNLARSDDMAKITHTVLPNDFATYIAISGSFETVASTRGTAVQNRNLKRADFEMGNIAGIEILRERDSYNFTGDMASFSRSFIVREARGEMFHFDTDVIFDNVKAIVEGKTTLSRLLSFKVNTIDGWRLITYEAFVRSLVGKPVELLQRLFNAGEYRQVVRRYASQFRAAGGVADPPEVRIEDFAADDEGNFSEAGAGRFLGILDANGIPPFVSTIFFRPFENISLRSQLFFSEKAGLLKFGFQDTNMDFNGTTKSFLVHASMAAKAIVPDEHQQHLVPGVMPAGHPTGWGIKILGRDLNEDVQMVDFENDFDLLAFPVDGVSRQMLWSHNPIPYFGQYDMDAISKRISGTLPNFASDVPTFKTWAEEYYNVNLLDVNTSREERTSIHATRNTNEYKHNGLCWLGTQRNFNPASGLFDRVEMGKSWTSTMTAPLSEYFTSTVPVETDKK